MASTAASTVAEYLAGLPAERRKVVRTLRARVKRALPKGYKEMDMGKACLRFKALSPATPETCRNPGVQHSLDGARLVEVAPGSRDDGEWVCLP